jgi:hypothetical protein
LKTLGGVYVGDLCDVPSTSFSDVAGQYTDFHEMTREELLVHLESLNEELKKEDIYGEIDLVGGAVMCLVFKSRNATYDIDAIFEPKMKIYACIKRVANNYNNFSNNKKLKEDWLNDAVKGYLSPTGEFNLFSEMSNLKILTASAEYMLAMKCLASRIDSPNESNDIKFLLKHLKLTSIDMVVAVITKFYPKTDFLPKTKYLLQELIDDVHT